MRSSLSLLLVVVALAGPARADEIEVNYTVDGLISGAATLAYVLSETVFKDALAPADCRWCDDDVNGVDRWFRDELVLLDIRHPHTMSNLTAFVMTPAVAFVLLAGASADEDRGRNWSSDALAVYEAAIVSACLNQVVKFSVGRRRPFVTFGVDNPGASPNDYNLSFYSGHTNFAFALAVASGTVASLRGYRAAPGVWAAGLTFAVTTGYLRIAADRHYFTDVLTGALIGSAMGFALPYFLHRKEKPDGIHVSVGPGGVSFSMAW